MPPSKNNSLVTDTLSQVYRRRGVAARDNNTSVVGRYARSRSRRRPFEHLAALHLADERRAVLIVSRVINDDIITSRDFRVLSSPPSDARRRNNVAQTLWAPPRKFIVVVVVALCPPTSESNVK